MKCYRDDNHIREAAVDAFCDMHKNHQGCWYYEPTTEGGWEGWEWHAEDLEGESAYWSEVALWHGEVGNDE